MERGYSPESELELSELESSELEEELEESEDEAETCIRMMYNYMRMITDLWKEFS